MSIPTAAHRDTSPFRFLKSSLLLAAGVVGFQNFLFLGVTRNNGDIANRMIRWDAAWNLHVAVHGYRTVFPPVTRDEASNVAFFPAFPFLARLFSQILPVSPQTALILAGEVAALLFWSLFVLHLKRAGVSRLVLAGSVGVAASLPGAFYLILPYSEALMLAGALGMILDWGMSGCKGVGASGFWGAVASASRLPGVPLAALPALSFAMADSKRWRRGVQISFLSSVGFIAFLLYCQIRFGHWNLYFETQKQGWGLNWNPFQALSSLSVRPLLWSRLWYREAILTRLLMTWTGLGCLTLSIWTVCIRIHARKVDISLASLVLAANLNWWIPVFAFGMNPVSVTDGLRHFLPVSLFLILASCRLPWPGSQRFRTAATLGAALLIPLLILAQVYCAGLYSSAVPNVSESE